MNRIGKYEGVVRLVLLLVVLAADYFVYDRHERARKG